MKNSTKYNNTQTHCFNGHFPRKTGLAAETVDLASPFVLDLKQIYKEA